MDRRLLWFGPPLLAVGIILFAVLGRLPGQDAQPGDRAARDRKVYEALRDVIERGRTLYNVNRDYTGCYRIYEGGLLAVRPLLDHRPDLQKQIAEGLAQAERIPVNWQQAFALRKVIDLVREQVRDIVYTPAPDQAPKDVKPPKTEDKFPPPPVDKALLDKRPLDQDKVPVDRKDEDKVRPADKDKVILDRKVEDKRREDKAATDRKPTDKREDKRPTDRKAETDKKPEEKAPPEDQATVKGQVLFQGKPLTSGFVTFVSADGRKYSASIKADGSYAFKSVTLPPGEYKVMIENSVTLGKGQERGPEVPRQYRSPETTPLTLTLRPGQNAHDLNLR